MIREVKNVTDVIKEVPEKRKAALSKLRQPLQRSFERLRRNMAYGGPTYKK